MIGQKWSITHRVLKNMSLTEVFFHAVSKIVKFGQESIDSFQLAITCSKLTIKTLGQGVKYVESEQYISYLVLVFLLLALSW